MALPSSPNPILPQTLPDGLIIRRSRAADMDQLAEFNAMIHSDTEEPDLKVAEWTRDLLRGTHPTFGVDDFSIVENPKTGKIVSAVCLISQTWTFAGIPIKVGRPELVGTDPEYRRKGLVRRQFDLVHEWSRQRGELLQAITGIPYYYRQFGYEMALDLAGRRAGFEAHVPKLKEGEEEPYLIRAATTGDLPFMADLYHHAAQRHAVACVRTPEIFKYELDGQSEDNGNRYETYVIEDASAERVGYFQHTNYLGRTGVSLIWYELKPGVSWLAVTPGVVRHTWNKGQEYARRDGKTCHAFGFMLGAQHPVYEALGRDLPTEHQPYAWYLRVPNMLGFLNHIKPALEKRIAESIAAGHSREIKISFYRNGVRLVLEKGKLASIESWSPSPEEEGHVGFPGLTFIQILFGYRSYDDLEQSFADCWCDSEEVRALIKILFPKKFSDVFPVA